MSQDHIHGEPEEMKAFAERELDALSDDVRDNLTRIQKALEAVDWDDRNSRATEDELAAIDKKLRDELDKLDELSKDIKEHAARYETARSGG